MVIMSDPAIIANLTNKKKFKIIVTEVLKRSNDFLKARSDILWRALRNYTGAFCVVSSILNFYPII